MGVFDRIFGAASAPLIGLDITGSSVKLVELGHAADGRWSVEHLATERLEKGWVVDGLVEKFDEVAEALRRVVARSGTRTRRAAVALPASAVITRRLSLPAGLRDDEMEVQVEAEAHNVVPFPLDEVSLDFCVLGPSLKVPGDVEVMMAAARRERVEDREGLLQAAGLEAAVVEVESFAGRLAMGRLIAGLPESGQGAIVAWVEVGADLTRLRVLLDGELLHEREQAFGGAQLTQTLARRYGYSPEEAERRKLARDLPEDHEAAVFEPFAEHMAQEVARALQVFYTSTPHSRVDHIMLAGGSVQLPGLRERVAAQAGVVTSLANPFEGMAIGRHLRETRLRREAPAYLTACGLAMRGRLA